MSIRMMPMEYVFSRFPRLVRDLASKLNKQIELTQLGSSTELDKSLIEASLDLGAGHFKTFMKVVVPLAAPGIVTAAILVFIFAWNDLLLALSLTATKSAITAPVAIANFTGSSQFEEPTGSIAAGAMVITIPIIIFVLIFQRRIVAGLTSGAVKG